jgi:pimeloyl-ACP methyl ester carboxylesterase
VISGPKGARRVKEIERVLPNLTQKLIIDAAGHWIQQKRPAEVNAALIAFVRGCVAKAQ